MNELLEFSLDVENSEKNYAMARWYENAGHTAPAHSFYLRAAERSKDPLLSYTALIRASFCYKAQGSRTGTEKVLIENALTILPNRPEAYFFLSMIYQAREDWQNCYIYASLGLACASVEVDLKDIPEYTGKYLLMYQKAISAWWWGKGKECRQLFTKIVSDYWNEISDKYKLIIKTNLERIGLDHIVITSKKKFFDCGTHLFQGFKKISEIHNIDHRWECYCFEANPRTYNASKKTYLELVKKGLDIKHFDVAVSNTDGETRLNSVGSDAWDGTELGTFTSRFSNILKSPPQICEEKELDYEQYNRVVKTVDFSKFIKTFSDPDDFIVVKLNIEGSEFDTLDRMIEDGTIDRINEFYIEFHPHYFEDTKLYEEKICNYDMVFRDKGIKFIRWGS